MQLGDGSSHQVAVEVLGALDQWWVVKWRIHVLTQVGLAMRQAGNPGMS